jgi:hypothetical protein
MTLTDKAIAILAATKDGDQLQGRHLALVQAAVNGNLSETGIAAFEQLHQSVISGAYMQEYHWLHGIEHLTKDGQGYVYWKGQHVEHYSFSDTDREATAAHKLAEKCHKLEAIGFPVNGRTALSKDCYEAPAGTPWMTALCRYYAFFKDGNQTVGIFYRRHVKAGESEVVAAHKNAEGIHLTPYPGAYEAYHALAGKGLTSAGIPNTYEETAALLEGTGLSGKELEEIINAPA